MLTDKQKDELREEIWAFIFTKIGNFPDKDLSKAVNQIIDNSIALSTQTVIEQILKETKGVEPTLVWKYIEEQLYLPYFGKQKNKLLVKNYDG